MFKLQEVRRVRLEEVFEAFDEDGSGVIETNELMAMGQAMSATWSEEQNVELLKRMDINKDGVVQRGEFVRYSEAVLPQAKPDLNPNPNCYLNSNSNSNPNLNLNLSS